MTRVGESSNAGTAPGARTPQTMSESEIEERFLAFVSAFRAREPEALVAQWTPDVRAWHSTDCHAKDRDEYLAFIAALPKMSTRFVDVRRQYFPNGFVQQHIVEITHDDGRTEENYVCLVVVMEDGLISRIDEHITSRPGLA